MNDPLVSRRDFVKATALTAATLPLASVVRAATSANASSSAAASSSVVKLHWLEGNAPAVSPGATWGVPWPRGAHAKDATFALRTNAGDSVPVQSWPTAYWPDGSLKWTAHAISADAGRVEEFQLAPGAAAAPAKPVVVSETDDAIEIDTGVLRCRVSKKGSALIAALARDGREQLRNGRLVALRQDSPGEPGRDSVVRTESFVGDVSSAVVEQSGPVRAVVKVEGRHVAAAAAPSQDAGAAPGDRRAWLPFVVRLYFYAGAESVRVMHTFVFDGDEQRDFIRGLGMHFEVPMSDELHNRHVRFVGEGNGLWAEAIRTLTGLRRDPGAAVRDAQIAGKATPPVETFPANVRNPINYIPAWGDFSLVQPTAGAFQIRKRTKPGHGWIDADQGTRASGVGYIGGATGGGVVFGLRDFWQRHPTQLDIRGANTDIAEVTLWMWSPDAPPMDLRFYHDGMGMETHPQELAAMDITYEDYEKGWGTPQGIARSSEIMLWPLPATPTRERIVEFAAVVRTPPLVTCDPKQFLAAKVFGALWSPPDRSTPARRAIEDRLDWQFDFYRGQVEQRHWYGFWNYGDVMHTYDRDRHVWRYDVGGFGWDNSELSPDLWLWYAFLRSGRADVFRFAEAQVRHSSDVDMYHLGRFAGLGTRHGVQHWGDSAKQVRISTAAYRRFYYFLTADERIGDVLRELLDVDAKLEAVDPVRKLPNQAPKGDYPERISVGTDWCSLAAAWLTEWERGGDTKYRDKLLQGMRDIGAARHGFFSGDRFGYDPANGKIYNILGDDVSVSHLNAVFGAVEICAELIQLTEGQKEYEPFEKAWLDYCVLYNATREEQTKVFGHPLSGISLQQAHSRLTAYAASRRKDPALAQRAWSEFAKDYMKPTPPVKVTGPAVLNAIDEAAWLSTNDAAQWGLAAIQNLALIGDTPPG